MAWMTCFPQKDRESGWGGACNNISLCLGRNPTEQKRAAQAMREHRAKISQRRRTQEPAHVIFRFPQTLVGRGGHEALADPELMHVLILASTDNA